MFYINNNIEVSEKLKDIRLRSKVSQKEIANAVGKSLGYISNIENNVTRRIETDVVRYYFQLAFNNDDTMIENELQKLIKLQNPNTIVEIEIPIRNIFSNIFDKKREYAERKLKNIGKNIKNDSSLMFAYMSMSINRLVNLPYNQKQNFLKDIEKLIEDYTKDNTIRQYDI